jgi:hypothetical protein
MMPIVEATGAMHGGHGSGSAHERAMVQALQQIEYESGRIWADESIPEDERRKQIDALNTSENKRAWMKAAVDRVEKLRMNAEHEDIERQRTTRMAILQKEIDTGEPFLVSRAKELMETEQREAAAAAEAWKKRNG